MRCSETWIDWFDSLNEIIGQVCPPSLYSIRRLSHTPIVRSLRWNSVRDVDGISFREKMFAVFPGFDTNVNNESGCVHIVFLFDPVISRDNCLRRRV